MMCNILVGILTFFKRSVQNMNKDLWRFLNNISLTLYGVTVKVKLSQNSDALTGRAFLEVAGFRYINMEYECMVTELVT